MANAPKSGTPAAPAAAPKAAPPKPGAPQAGHPAPKPGAPVFGKKPAPLSEEAGDDAPPKTEPQKFWRTRKGMLAIAGVAIVVVAAGVETWAYLRHPPPPASGVYDRARDPDILSGGAQAADGATLVLGGLTIALQGIRAPRATAVCSFGGRDFNCGAAARLELQKQIGTAGVECVRTGEAPGGTIIALCRTEDGLDLAAAQVRAGWAVADVSRSSRYVPEQRRAEDNGSGLWRDDLARPEAWK